MAQSKRTDPKPSATASLSMRHLLLLPLVLISSLACAELPETDWLELMPEEDRLALETMPEISHEGAEMESGFYIPGGLKQQTADLPAVMYSTKTVPAFDGKQIRLGGYPVPWKPTPPAAAPCSSWCHTPVPASTSRHRHPTNWCWCATQKASNSKTSTPRSGSAAR